MLKAHVKVKCTSQSQRSLEQLLPGSSHFSRAMYEEDPDEVDTIPVRRITATWGFDLAQRQINVYLYK